MFPPLLHLMPGLFANRGQKVFRVSRSQAKTKKKPRFCGTSFGALGRT